MKGERRERERETLSVPVSSSIFSTFSSIQFMVSALMLRSLIHLEFSFMQGDKYRSVFILLHTAIQFDQPYFVEDAVFSPVCNFCFSVKNQVSVELCLGL